MTRGEANRIAQLLFGVGAQAFRRKRNRVVEMGTYRSFMAAVIRAGSLYAEANTFEEALETAKRHEDAPALIRAQIASAEANKQRAENAISFLRGALDEAAVQS